MRQTAIRFILALIVGGAALGLPSKAEAHKLDLALSRFIECSNAQGTLDPTNCKPQLSEYESFMAQYAFGLAPKILAPAETLGYSGFYMGLEGTITPRNGLEGAWEKGTVPDGERIDVMFMPTIHVRKGLPWSFELGGSISYLAASELVALGAEIKWSLFEGYRHKWQGPFPDVAARGSVQRVIGEADADITIIGVDASISYSFGIAGMVTLTPYAGYQHLWSIIRPEPLILREEGDTINYRPETNGNWNSTGLSGPNLSRHKLFLGFRFGYEMLVFSFDLGWGLKKKWDPETSENVPQAEVGNQVQISLGVGIDF